MKTLLLSIFMLLFVPRILFGDEIVLITNEVLTGKIIAETVEAYVIETDKGIIIANKAFVVKVTKVPTEPKIEPPVKEEPEPEVKMVVVKCPDCDGKKFKQKKCPTCNGSGKDKNTLVKCTKCTFFNPVDLCGYLVCPDCFGRKFVYCKACNGKGTQPGSDAKCQTCKGNSSKQCDKCDTGGFVPCPNKCKVEIRPDGTSSRGMIPGPCETCNSTGKTLPCETCAGTGRVEVPEE